MPINILPSNRNRESSGDLLRGGLSDLTGGFGNLAQNYAQMKQEQRAAKAKQEEQQRKAKYAQELESHKFGLQEQTSRRERLEQQEDQRLEQEKYRIFHGLKGGVPTQEIINARQNNQYNNQNQTGNQQPIDRNILRQYGIEAGLSEKQLAPYIQDIEAQEKERHILESERHGRVQEEEARRGHDITEQGEQRKQETQEAAEIDRLYDASKKQIAAYKSLDKLADSKNIYSGNSRTALGAIGVDPNIFNGTIDEVAQKLIAQTNIERVQGITSPGNINAQLLQELGKSDPSLFMSPKGIKATAQLRILSEQMNQALGEELNNIRRENDGNLPRGSIFKAKERAKAKIAELEKKQFEVITGITGQNTPYNYSNDAKSFPKGEPFIDHKTGKIKVNDGNKIVDYNDLKKSEPTVGLQQNNEQQSQNPEEGYLQQVRNQHTENPEESPLQQGVRLGATGLAKGASQIAAVPSSALGLAGSAASKLHSGLDYAFGNPEETAKLGKSPAREIFESVQDKLPTAESTMDNLGSLAPEGYLEPKNEYEKVATDTVGDIISLAVPGIPTPAKLKGIKSLLPKAATASGVSNLAGFLAKKMNASESNQELVKTGMMVLTSLGFERSLKKRAGDYYEKAKELAPNEFVKVPEFRKSLDKVKEFAESGLAGSVESKDELNKIIKTAEGLLGQDRAQIKQVIATVQDMGEAIAKASKKNPRAVPHLLEIKKGLTKSIINNPNVSKEIADYMVKGNSIYRGVAETDKAINFIYGNDKIMKALQYGVIPTFMKLGALGAGKATAATVGALALTKGGYFIKNVLTNPPLRNEFLKMMASAFKKNQKGVIYHANKFDEKYKEEGLNEGKGRYQLLNSNS